MKNLYEAGARCRPPARHHDHRWSQA
jgi:hypothetical protein